VRVAVTPVASTAERIEQRVILCERIQKPGLLAETLKNEPTERTLVFTRTKHGADKVARGLAKANITAEAIHGNKSQNQRERVLAAFRSGKVRTLVATDIAARGIDVDGVSHVVNYDLPNVPESYVHRIGRTARAGAEGIAISLVDHEEMAFLRGIEKLIGLSIPATDRRTGRPSGGQRPSPQGQHRNGQHAQPRNGQHAQPRNGQHAEPRSGQHAEPRSGRNGKRRRGNQQRRDHQGHRDHNGGQQPQPRRAEPHPQGGAASHSDIGAVAFMQRPAARPANVAHETGRVTR
jgi:ATP-dependent RNA helicase RhlE